MKRVFDDSQEHMNRTPFLPPSANVETRGIFSEIVMS